MESTAEYRDASGVEGGRGRGLGRESRQMIKVEGEGGRFGGLGSQSQ